MRVVITGGTGNVATALLRRLRLEPDVRLVGIARRPPRAIAAPYDTVGWLAYDIGEPTSVPAMTRVMRGADAVVHTAWAIQPSHDQDRLERTNVAGSEHVVQAAARAGVPHLVNLSSVGVYSPGPKDREVDESWPNRGVPTSSYSVHKVAVEDLINSMASRFDTVTHVRPGLVFQRDAASAIARLFVGPLLPTTLLERVPVPVVPLPRSIVTQTVHAADLAELLTLVLQQRAGGPFNVATEPWLTPPLLAAAVRGRWVPLSQPVLRAAVATAWRARLLPIDAGWIDLACSAPVLSTARARTELGWAPTLDAHQTLADLLSGMASGAGTASPQLRGRDDVGTRVRSARSGRLPGTAEYP